MRTIKNIFIASLILSCAFINASQKDVKVNKEVASEKAPFVPSDELLQKAATATQKDKDYAAYSAAIGKRYDEVEFWFEQGANLEYYFKYVFITRDAKAVELSLRYGVDWTKTDLISNVYYHFNDHHIDIADLFLADPRFKLETQLLKGAALSHKKNIAKRLFFFGLKSEINDKECPPGDFKTPYEYAMAHGTAEIKEMFEKAKKGDFSFISDDERKHFTAIAAKRMGMKSGNVFNHLRAQKLGLKLFPRLNRLGLKAKVTKKDDAKDEGTAAANSLEKLNLKDGSA